MDFEELVNDLEQQKIVVPSKSKWLNPAVLVKKSNGKSRFCLDLRRLNDRVEGDSYPLPRIQELIATLRDIKYFLL